MATTVEECKADGMKLQQAMLGMVREFEEKHGVFVSSISLCHRFEMGSVMKKTIDLKLEVQLH